MTTERKNYDDIEVNSFEDLNLKENVLLRDLWIWL